MIEKKGINIELFFAMIFSAEVIEEIVRSILTVCKLQDNILVSAINIGIYFIACLCLMYNWKNKCKDRLIINRTSLYAMTMFLALVCIWVVSIILSRGQTMFFTSHGLKFVPVAMIYFYCGGLDIQIEKTVIYLGKVLPFVILYGILSICFMDLNVIYLNLASNVLFFFFIAHMCFLVTKRKIYMCECIVLGGIIFVSGARMALVCCVFYLFMVFYFRRAVSAKTLGLMVATGGASVVVVLILNAIGKLPRSIVMIFQGEFFSSGERTKIYTYLMDLIANEPLKIRGFFGDRIAIADEFLYTRGLGFWLLEENKYGVYAHNMFIELLTDFGLVIGGILCLLIGGLLIINLKKLWHMENVLFRSFFSAVVTMGFLNLMVSSSYLTNYSFWFFLGYMLTFSKKRYCYESEK